jgi:hypothetical protein
MMLFGVPDIIAMQCITYVMLVWIFALSGEVMLDGYRQTGPSLDDGMYDREQIVYHPLTEMNSFEEIIGVILIVVPNRTHIVYSEWLYHSHEKFRQCCFSLPKAAMLVANNLYGLSPLLKSSLIQMANGAKAVNGFQRQNDIWKI